MQATLKSCLVVVTLILLALAPPVPRRIPVANPTQTTPVVRLYSQPQVAEVAATHTRLINYLKAHWKAPADLAKTVVQAAHRQSELTGLPVSLILAVIAKESSFNPEVRSGYGAEGLMQVVAFAHQDKLERREKGALQDPVQNIEVGTQVLKEYLGRANGDTRRALKKYSGGAHAYYEHVMWYRAKFEQAAEDDAYL